MARIVRGQVLSLREKEFIEAARSVGASDRRIIFRELLPNLTAPIVVYATTLLPQVMLYEAALDFLGVGVQPPTASWGQMISSATPNFNTEWWYMLFPGIALLITVLAFNFVGDAMQDALNPRASRLGVKARRRGRPRMAWLRSGLTAATGRGRRLFGRT
jgi:ABC-type dipeptide/oligopeptide/nickel transport system permease subunit